MYEKKTVEKKPFHRKFKIRHKSVAPKPTPSGIDSSAIYQSNTYEQSF